ncbi:MAG: gamma-glutamyltransferase [Bacillota bacterium]
MFRVASHGLHDVTAYGGVSSSSHPWATAAGVQMLLRGGNAMDAALATAFALTVVEPAMSHLGGQGNMLVHMAKEGKTVALDFYPTAPAAAHESMYEWIPTPTQGGYRFWTKDDLNTTGALSVCVPGNVAAWLYAHRRWGSLPLEVIVEPAITYARQGAPMTRRMAAFSAEARDRLARFPATARLFLRSDGSPLQEGDVVIQEDLARTLTLIAREGEEVFYRGEIARAIVSFLQEQGGIITMQDLERYPREDFRVVAPERVPYRGYEVEATPANSSVVLLPIMRLLNEFDLSRYEPLAGEKLHILAECMKLAFADRLSHTGDPGFFQIPVDGLLSPGYTAARRALVRMDAAGYPAAGDPWPYQSEAPRERKTNSRQLGGDDNAHTTHHSHVDRHGNFISFTQSLGDAFGSALVVPGYGIILNNAMKLFDPRPGFNNSVGPRKRPATAPCPAMLLRDGRPVMALGSPSGTRIINAVAQTIVNVVDHQMSLQAAVNLPRIHWSGDEFELEKDIPEESKAILRALGHDLQERNAKSPWFGAIQAVARDPETGLCHGAADPRRQGAAAGCTLL